MLVLGLLALSLPVSARLSIPPRMELPWGDPGMGLYRAAFYPLGFSKKGHFAYFTFKTEADGIGEITEFRFYLIDLVNDSVVEKIDFSDSDQGSLSLEQVWNAQSPRIQNLLDAFKVKSAPMVLIPFPTVLDDGSRFDVKVDIVDDDDSPYTISSYTIHAIRDGKSKQVFDAPEAHSLGVKPAGMLKSPWEDRAALVFIEYFYSFEGSRDAYPRIVGCHLTKGYK